MRTIGVAVAGLGFVGRQTVKLLVQNQDRFSRRLGARLEVVAVCDRDVVREAKALRLPKKVRRVRAPLELLSVPGVDVVVEVMGGLDAPRQLALAALEAGRHVVTANKRLLAHSWSALQTAGASSGARLYFEGSVAGGIPILQALDAGFAANRIESVYGILNGTTNYILSRLEEGRGFDEALKEAQLKGFAEKDPTMDLSGADTAQKVSVLSALLTGAPLPDGRIERQGIAGIEREDVTFARESLRRTPRLLGALKLSWGDGVAVSAHVAPTLVPLSHPLAAVRDEYNAVLVRASEAGDLMFYGKGAGPGPTASAVVGDVLMLARDVLGGQPSPARAAKLATRFDSGADVSAFYLRLSVADKPGVLAQIAASLGERSISIASIHQPEAPGRGGASVILTTHETRASDFSAALKKILSLPAVARRHTVMRILS
jgi:homoserine dehydrogenase